MIRSVMKEITSWFWVSIGSQGLLFPAHIIHDKNLGANSISLFFIVIRMFWNVKLEWNEGDIHYSDVCSRTFSALAFPE